MRADDLTALFERVPLFADLCEAERRDLEGAFRPVTFKPGELIFRQGAEPDGLYLVAEGWVTISVRLPGDDEIGLRTVGPDEVFGEMAIANRQSRSSSTSARALTETRAWLLDTQWYEGWRTQLDPSIFKVMRRLALLMSARLRTDRALFFGPSPAALEAPAPSPQLPPENPQKMVTLDPPTLRVLPIFSDFTDKELMTMVERMQRHELPRGHVVFTEGEPGASCFIIVRGAVEVTVVERSKKRLVTVLGPSGMFGQGALLSGEPRSATCTVREHAVMLELDKASMDELCADGAPIAFKFMAMVLRTLSHVQRRADAMLARDAALEQAQGIAPR